MSDKTGIEWTDATWTPIRARVLEIQNDGSGKERIGWHCEHVSEGCRFCYAEGINRRLGTRLDFKPGNLFVAAKKGFANGEAQMFLDENMLMQPLRWRRRRMIFVCSMTDLFADFVPDAWIDRVFAVMALCPQHTFQVLTKRPERMKEYLSRCRRARIKGAAALRAWLDQPDELNPDPDFQLPWPLPNVWLGTSAEDQQRAAERIPQLLDMPTAVRFLSAEPLLGRIEIQNYLSGAGGMSRLDWVIVGGESGPGARPMHPDWARSLRDQCAAAGVPFFFKQWGEHKPVGHVDRGTATDPNEFAWERVGKKAAGRLLDGVEHNGMPGVRP